MQQQMRFKRMPEPSRATTTKSNSPMTMPVEPPVASRDLLKLAACPRIKSVHHRPRSRAARTAPEQAGLVVSVGAERHAGVDPDQSAAVWTETITSVKNDAARAAIAIGRASGFMSADPSPSSSGPLGSRLAAAWMPPVAHSVTAAPTSSDDCLPGPPPDHCEGDQQRQPDQLQHDRCGK